MSFLCVYLRAIVDAQLHRWTKIVMVCIFFWVVGSIIYIFLACSIRDLWSTTANCPQRIPLYMASGVVAIATDFVILALPMRVVWSLQISRARRFGLTVLISLGLL